MDQLILYWYVLKYIHSFNTMTGQNVRHILDEYHDVDIFQINLAKFKRTFKFHEMPTDEMRKGNLVKEITDIQHSVLVLGMDDDRDLPGFAQDELCAIRYYVATF